jgi:ribonuclease E
MVKSVQTICNEIYVELRKMARHFEKGDVMLRVNPEVAKALKGGSGRWIMDMEDLVKRTVMVKSDPLLHQEQFDIQ